MDQVPAPAHYLCQYHRDLARARQGLPPEAPTVTNNQVSIFDFIETSSDEDDDDEEAEDSLTRSQFYIELVWKALLCITLWIRILLVAYVDSKANSKDIQIFVYNFGNFLVWRLQLFFF